MRFYLLYLASALLSVGCLHAADYYVSPSGADDPARDGLSAATAWASLHYACSQVPAGEHTINLAAGTYLATETAYPQQGVTILGMGREVTSVEASVNWDLRGTFRELNDTSYVFAARGKNDLRFSGFTLRSESQDQRAHGGIHCRSCDNLEVDNMHFEDFAWAGVYIRTSDFCTIRDNMFMNASHSKDGIWGGELLTNFFNDSQVFNNTFITAGGSPGGFGRGYKGQGHRTTKIFNNTFNVQGGFALEVPHENEFDLEIYDNSFNATLSLPKSGQNSDPTTNNRGPYTHTIWVHDNIMNDSYTIEGPRNHMRINNNFIDVTSDQLGGRVLSIFGGTNTGPVWIHNNVVIGADRSFIWRRNGVSEDINVYNNTVFLGDYETAGRVIGQGTQPGVDGWTIHNNIFIAHPDRPRSFAIPDDPGITATHNLMVNITEVPPGNFTGEAPGFLETGDIPFPYYTPASENSFIVDRGLDIGEPFLGLAPDLGAFESDFTAALPVSWAGLKARRETKGRASVAWSTGSETNNARFEVERRTEWTNWRVVATVKAVVDSPGGGDYRVQDPEAPESKTYYRVRQVDFDGSSTASSIVSLAAIDRQAFTIYPTVTSGQLILSGGTGADFEVIDASGRIILRRNANVSMIDVAGLAPGHYIIRHGESTRGFVKQ